MKQKKVYVVPHSHWDREWYFTIEDSNLLLVENMDRLMDVMEKDPNYTGYVFDAQSSILDEYLKIRPEEKERLASLIQNKRIFVGPWYTQADSLLVNKESLIRNLLYGTRIAEKMGHSMNIGYLPDIFGQNTYLPSIFNEFGIDYSILQRGIYTDQLKGDLNFTWKSPDGKSVKANNTYFGYGPGKFLSDEQDYMEERLLPILDKISAMNKSTDNLLLPAGGDQVLIREQFPETVKALNEKDEKHEYILSDYETFMNETFHEADRFTNEIEGELIATQKSRIHNTIRSQRYDIKKLNDIAEKKLIHELEPLGSIASTLGLRYPNVWLDEMWKMLFDVHAHDSIGGCNSDDTNQEIVNRLTKVIRMANGCLNLLKKQITEAISGNLNNDSILVLFQLLPTPFEGSQTAILFTREKAFSVKDLEGNTVEMDNLNQDYMSGGKTIVVTAEGEKQVEAPGYYRNEVLLQNLELPAMGYQTYEVVEDVEASSEKPGQVDKTKIENDHLAIFVEDESLKLAMKSSGQIIPDFLTFENVADAGDSYDFSPLKGDEPIYSRVQSVNVSAKKGVQMMNVEHELHVPANLKERESGMRTKELVILSTFELRTGENFLRVTHNVNNDVKDHRVRVLLQTSLDQPEHSFGDQGFSFIQRPTVNPYMASWKEQKFAEAPVPIYPLENIAGATDSKLTAAVVTKGIKEYQLIKETGELALTLFRSVGLLGRDDLEWRPGRASGINNKVVYTPDAQMQGEMTFDYAVHFSESYDERALFKTIDRYNDHAVSYQKQTLNTFEERLDRFEIPYPVMSLPTSFSLMQSSNENVFFSSMKQAHDDRTIIIRLFNPRTQEQKVQLLGEHVQSITQTTLDEKNGIEMNEDVTVPSKGYVTLKLTTKVDVQ
ncbi:MULTISPECIES: glycoside hydrolase family 38 C-terminal domain-containing protein [Bacillaceae]|uniref:glycoside hydrolase family 38 N-terminal domain-containing protein n=1 Tax=Bacillales TaxID=1385 RepID=UPI0018836E4A|nr:MULTISPECIES: glycoside hydrolase family 38 C-terminal domain-containing protein [Bacillaceae]MBF0707681.1 alpha-mannosidase [Pseudalkalibacillus hwajinpoensis]MDO6654546.1 glycoside hydrolase family 38 C-terminal domain-containing protein [Anaerobacillus sp. 1_MG-2023]